VPLRHTSHRALDQSLTDPLATHITYLSSFLSTIEIETTVFIRAVPVIEMQIGILKPITRILHAISDDMISV
jgi:hypothetical protein